MTPLVIDPPLLNTANPWATDLADLARLYACPHTGAVTTRTSLLAGFPHDPAVHQFTFFDAATHTEIPQTGSLNNLGYSPLPLAQYLGFIREIAASHPASPTGKPKGFVVSVTGTPHDVARCYAEIAAVQADIPHVPLAMEVNLSCPNIPDKPPPAYNGEALQEYLAAIKEAININSKETPPLAVGFKTPPYTHAGQFDVLMGALRASAGSGVCPLSFLTATNTLGSSLVMAYADDGGLVPALPNGGLGGMAGAPLHPLALGNVATLRRLLDAVENRAALGHVRIIGAGGVSDAAGYGRMKRVGAYAVGVGTGLGISGIEVFGSIVGQ